MEVSDLYDIAIIGAGSGGLVVASGAAQLGARVALIEKDRMGGECLNTGCVPSKALLRSSKVLALMRRSADFGLKPCSPEVNFKDVHDHVQRVIAAIAPHDSVERFESLGCDVYLGDGAVFLDPNRIQVGDKVIRSKKFVIATGSKPVIPGIPGAGQVELLTNENIFDLKDLPPALTILGGGPIALELGQAFHRFGSKVTIIQRSRRILSRDDHHVGECLEEVLSGEGVKIFTGTQLERMDEGLDCKKVVFFRHEGESISVEGDEVLAALGRRPNIGSLNLEAAGVEYTDRGITVDKSMRTSVKHIYACGDCTGGLNFTHVAGYEAGVIIKSAIFKLPAKADYRVVPKVTYTEPEAASVGLSETEARELHPKVKVYKVPFSDNDRAICDVSREGFVKMIVRKGGDILGCHIVGPGGGELIGEVALAMNSRLKVGDIMGTIHAYPTLSELLKGAASEGMKESLTPLRRRIIKLIFGLKGRGPE